ncbi:MAG: beta-propeller fold lactonase family protein [candidate division Zixibacteria bacterium]|nr:beta-propeller fold lactonase family protein [candidate division Zixibacteria bacterium]
MHRLLMILIFFTPLLSFAGNIDPNGDIPLHRILAERGQTVDEILAQNTFDFSQNDIDPGEIPEGDYLGWLAFTPDGERILVTNRVTDNVTVFDWSTMEVLTNINVGTYPGGIGVTDNYAVIACAFSDEVYIIDLDDYSVAGIFETGEQPWVVRISPDGRKAYVACDIDNVCEVIDLENLIHTDTLEDFPIWLVSWGFNSENARNTFSFSPFEITPDGNHIMVSDGETNVHFINVDTGNIDYTVEGIESCWTLGLSGDGSKSVAVSSTDPAVAYQIDLTTYQVTGSVSISGYRLSTYEVAVNQDGSKAFLGINNNSSAFVRFETSDFTVLTQTYTPFWIGVSPDHSLAIGGQYRFSILDFETETLLGQYQGNSQYYGAVSKVGLRAVGHDPYRHEGVYFYDYTDDYPDYLGTTNSGLDPEGDAPRRLAIAPDGSKVVAANVLSDNISIISLSTYEVEAILPIGDRVQNVAITSDSRWAVVCGFNSNSVFIIDLETNTIAAEVSAGSRAGVVSIAPDDSYAYVGNISANTLSVIELDGENSFEYNELPIGVIGVVWAAFGVSSDVEYSPDGEHVLATASFDDLVYVFDTEFHEIVATLPTGDFPIQIAFDGTGEYAVVTNYFTDNFTLMHIDGENSTSIGTYYSGDAPLRLAYNSILDEIGICNYSDKTLVNIDPQTGDLIDTDYYTNHGSLIQAMFDENGEPIVLVSSGNLPAALIKADDVVEMPAGPTYFDYNREAQVAAVSMPGPDFVTIVSWQETGIGEVKDIDLNLPTEIAIGDCYPNPFNPEVNIEFHLPTAGDISLRVLNLTGEKVVTLAEGNYTAGSHRILWDASDLASGIYLLKLSNGSISTTKRITYIK